MVCVDGGLIQARHNPAPPDRLLPSSCAVQGWLKSSCCETPLALSTAARPSARCLGPRASVLSTAAGPLARALASCLGTIHCCQTFCETPWRYPLRVSYSDCLASVTGYWGATYLQYKQQHPATTTASTQREEECRLSSSVGRLEEETRW